MKTGLTFEQALTALSEGKKVRLPEWVGHWFKPHDDKILVMTREGNVLDTPYLDDYKNRTDWMVTDGLRGFDGALVALNAGKKLTRLGWKGTCYIEKQVPDENGKMTKPYIYMTKGADRFPCDLSCESIFALDWEII